MRSYGTAAELERRRHLAVERVGEGYSAEEVADILGVAPRSVYRWLSAFRRGGPAALEARPARGRPAKLSYTQEKIVFRWLAQRPTELGFPTDLWAADRLAQLIERDLDVSLNPHYLCSWLRQRNYTPQKPRRVPRERDDAATKAWLTHAWPRIKTRAWRDKACLMLLDESGLLMAPLLRRSWAPKGHPSESNEKAGHRDKVSVAAALWLTPGRDRLNRVYQTLVNGFFNNEAVGEFLQAVMEELRKPLMVIWDRGPMHQGDPIEELLDRWEGRLHIEPLPSHSPDLMPVEYLWRCLKHGRLCNFAPHDVHQLHKAVLRELNDIARNSKLLHSFVFLSDLPLSLTLLS